MEWGGADELISIHAPRTGSDDTLSRQNRAISISIHAPRTGSDVPAGCCTTISVKFQSTLPARGATQHYDRTRYHLLFQSTLPARGATTMLHLLSAP